MESFPAACVVTLGLAVLASGCCCSGDCTGDKGEPIETVATGGGSQPAPTGSGSATEKVGGGPPEKAPCPGGVPPAKHQLDIPVVGQQSYLLCWAAVTEMIAKAFGKPEKAGQCTQLSDRNPDCGVPAIQQCVPCMESKSTPLGPCNDGGWPNLEAVGLQSERTLDEAVSLAKLKDEIACRGRPVAFTWHYGGTAGHIMLAYGYDGEDILVADPLPECEGEQKVVPYSTYVDGPSPGSTWHWDDFYAIEELSDGPIVTP